MGNPLTGTGDRSIVKIAPSPRGSFAGTLRASRDIIDADDLQGGRHMRRPPCISKEQVMAIGRRTFTEAAVVGCLCRRSVCVP